jgi:hypothetical protein
MGLSHWRALGALAAFGVILGATAFRGRGGLDDVPAPPGGLRTECNLSAQIAFCPEVHGRGTECNCRGIGDFCHAVESLGSCRRREAIRLAELPPTALIRSRRSRRRPSVRPSRANAAAIAEPVGLMDGPGPVAPPPVAGMRGFFVYVEHHRQRRSQETPSPAADGRASGRGTWPPRSTPSR